MFMTLTLYLLRELGKALGLALLIFSFLLLSFTTVKVIADGIRLVTLITVLPQLFPLISPMVLPLTIITGTLICYGRLSGTNEYLALQAGGIHPFWIAIPALLIAILASLVTVFLNADVLTWSTRNIQRSIIQDRTAIAEHQLKKQGSLSIGMTTLCRLQGADGHNAIDGTIFAPKRKDNKSVGGWDPQYPHPKKRIIAADHTIHLSSKDSQDVFIVLDDQINGLHYDLDRQYEKDYYVFNYNEGSLKIPIKLDKNISITSGRIRYWGIRLLLTRLKQLREEITFLSGSILRTKDITNWARFCAQLNEEAEGDSRSPSARLLRSMGTLQANVPERIGRVAYDAEPDKQLKQDVIQCLNALLRLRDFYRAEYYPPVDYPKLVWSQEVKTLNERKLESELADKKRRAKNFRSHLKAWDPVVIRMNRLALSVFFPESIPPPRLQGVPGSIQQSRRIIKTPEAAIFKHTVKDAARSYRKLTAELHLKLALSFSCFAFGLIGVPLGLLVQRRSASTGFAFGMIICLMYFVIIRTFQGMVRQGDFAYWTMWLPNLVLLTLGLFLWTRCLRIR